MRKSLITSLSYSKVFFSVLLVGLMLLAESCSKQVSNDRIEVNWPEVKVEMKPWTRWWWMGSAVDSANIGKLIEQYAAAGMGGVEITPIYGAVGFEDKYLSYLSPKWMENFHYTIRKANKEGMQVDMNVGTGWPFGGPQITHEFAASRLIIQNYELKAGEQLAQKIEVDDEKQKSLGVKLLALRAYNNADIQSALLDLTDKVDETGKLNWTPDTGEWTLYAAFTGKTRQKVKRAAPGGEGYTMDHMSKEALDTYLNRFESAFQGKEPGIRAFFNDSYEVYGADFSPNFFEEFKKRRGYDPTEYLRELTSKEKKDEIARIKSDYRETISDMLLENFSQPWSNWIHKQGGLSKNQAHGSPGNLLDLYAAVDIPETETFGSTYFPIPGLPNYTIDEKNVEPDPLMMKFASSAANVTGKPLTSSETFTWLGEHFKVPLAQCKTEVEQLFLAGINHVFFHGTTYSPEQAGWPGWLFYASTNMAPSNSFWPHIEGLNGYITRCQSFLQTGSSDNDILIYWPVYDIWHDSNERNKLLNIHAIEEWLHPMPFYQLSKKLAADGYSMDFSSDRQLKNASVKNGLIATSNKGQQYKTLILPTSEHMPIATLRQAIELAKAGATVIFQKLPTDVPGYYQLDERRKTFQQLINTLSFQEKQNGVAEYQIGEGVILLSDDVEKALTYKDVYRESLTDIGLKYIRKEINGNKFYYIVNHTASSIDSWIPLNSKPESVVVFDPQTGKKGLASTSFEDDKILVKVQMEPGEAFILQTASEKLDGIIDWKYTESIGTPLAVSSEWNLEFTAGGPDLPSTQTLQDLVSWTELPDKKAAAFSGTAVYTTEFDLAKKDADEYLLKLGDVRESARVWVNDKEVGILWSVPFQVRIGDYLKAGKNAIKIEVTNLMANRIIDLDKKGIEWMNYHEINFVDLNYKPFDASNWELQPSGLLGPVGILPLKVDQNNQ
ncbi:glycosyl hydrolase [Chondrinema litorale]|uniref:glycosyl hydrolase n=1 Tax=Chondrinema litorale TaxID=2994555 RepID=UPI0025433A06|nr:glycosyl hydrolase [Chondrinema litorale]UZR98829.1 glycosyl hydrolase [Chondrinema litorale]